MTALVEIPVALIEPSPYQPRADFDDDKLVQLMDSIRQRGVMQPVVVRQLWATLRGGPRYQLVMGERRLRACRRLGKQTIPAVVREMTDEEARRECLAENLIRADLKPMEKARAYGSLVEQGWSPQQIASRLSLTMAEVEIYLRLLRLRPEYQELVEKGVLPMTTAADVARLRPEDQPAIMAKVRAMTSRVESNEIARVITAMLEAQSQDRLIDAKGTKLAADRLFATLKTMARAIGTCTSRETMDLLSWVSAGDVDRNLQLAELCQKELTKVIERLRKARGRAEATKLLADKGTQEQEELI